MPDTVPNSETVPGGLRTLGAMRPSFSGGGQSQSPAFKGAAPVPAVSPLQKWGLGVARPSV